MNTKVKQLLANPRFIAIVGMLGSDGPGERANAAAMAGKMLADAGATWGELLAASGGPGTAGRRQEMPGTATELALVKAELRRTQHDLNEAMGRLKVEKRANLELKDKLKTAQEGLEAAMGTIERLKAAKKGWTPFENEVEVWTRPAPQAHLSWLTGVINYHEHRLNDFERTFLHDMEERPIVSEKQYKIFQRIAEKLRMPLDF